MANDIGDLIPHLDEELWTELNLLQKQIDYARVVVSDFEPRDGLYLLDRTVIGLLEGARRHAKVFHLAALYGNADDLLHPRRLVHETVVDLLYLMLERDPHRAAARIAVWECRTFDWAIHFEHEGVADDESAPPESGPAADPRFGAVYVESLAGLLDDPAEADLLLEVFDESGGSRPAYHWTGKGRFGERVRSLEGRMQRADSEGARLLRRLLEYDWRSASLRTHPRAGWEDVVLATVDLDEEPFSVRRQVMLIRHALALLCKRAALMLTTPLPWGSGR